MKETFHDFIILLARQRSGTTPFRSILATHADILCFQEVFNFGDRDSSDAQLRESNFFGFVERHTGGALRGFLPDRHELLFVDFLEYLRCFSQARYFVLDVKYNSSYCLLEPWSRDITSPYLFDLVEQYAVRVINLTRRNYLRYVLSAQKAWDSGRYSVSPGDAEYLDEQKHLDPDWTLAEIEKCAREDELIRQRFTGYRHFRSYDYTEVFPRGNTVSAELLADLAKWFDVPNTFARRPEYQRQATLPLDETIDNYEEIAALLQGTPYQYCLDDEPAYRRRRHQRQNRRRPSTSTE